MEVRRGRDHPSRDDAVVEDLAGVVHVGQERLQRPDPLLDAGLDRRPGLQLDDPGEHVEREGPLLAADVEGDALVEVGVLQRLEAVDEVGPAQVLAATRRVVGRARAASSASNISSYAAPAS